MSPTPEQHLILARSALDGEDPRHAAHHLAAALAIDPEREGLSDAIERWVKLAGDPLSLVPVEGESVYAGDAALHAFALAKLGHPAEAAILLLKVQAARPEVPYAERAQEWLSRDGAVAVLDLGRFAAACSACVEVPRLASALLPLLERVIATREPHDMTVFQAVRAARNAGKVERATQIALAGETRAPSFWTAVARGMAARAGNRVDVAIATYRDAAARDPSDVSALLDIGDIVPGRGAAAASAGVLCAGPRPRARAALGYAVPALHEVAVRRGPNVVTTPPGAREHRSLLAGSAARAPPRRFRACSQLPELGNRQWHPASARGTPHRDQNGLLLSGGAECRAGKRTCPTAPRSRHACDRVR